MRSLIVYFALLGILLCPYNCAVRAASKCAPATAKVAAGCCQHCQARQPVTERTAPEGDAPQRSAPAKDCPSCVCGGAVFDVSPRTVVDTLLLVSHAALAVDPAAEIPSSDLHCADSAGAGPPLVLGGHQLRILLASFVI